VTRESPTALYPLAEVYRGTSPYPMDWSDRFFGRSAEISDLANLAPTYPVVLLYGQSGTGKSSLVSAGLAASLGKTRCQICRVSGLVPAALAPRKIDNIYIFHLLQSIRGAEPEKLISALLEHALPALLPGLEDGFGEPWYLFVDQFEEILTTHPERWKERGYFWEQLRAAIRKFPALHFVLISREEFLAPFERYEALLPDQSRIRYYLERLTAAQAREAILKPAQLGGKDPGSISAAVDDAVKDLLTTTVEIDGTARDYEGEFVEPLHLQIVCEELVQSDFKPKTAGSDTGDVTTALTRYYNSAVKKVSRPIPLREFRLRRFIGRNLIIGGKRRGLVHKSKAKGRIGGVNSSTLQALEQTRILREENRDGETWYELSHDRLVEPIVKSNARVWDRVMLVASISVAVIIIVAAALTYKHTKDLRALEQAKALQRQEAEQRAYSNLQENLHQTDSALAEPKKAAALALPLWLAGDYDRARVLFAIGRDKAPLDSILAIDSALAGSRASENMTAAASYQAARKEFLRYPMILQRMKESKPLQDYVCRHNFTVIGASGPQTMVQRALTQTLSKYPNAEIGPPAGNNPNSSLLVDFFLTCEEADKLAWQLHVENAKAFPLIIGWYPCPGYSCPMPDYKQVPILGVQALPDARVGSVYSARVPGLTGAAVTSGVLPPGLTLGADGAIAGVPTKAQVTPYVFEVSQIRLSLRVVAAFKDVRKAKR
jgi:hypothetical protein